MKLELYRLLTIRVRQNGKNWNSDVEREFVCLYNHGYYQQSQKVERKRPGRPSYNIPKEVLVELPGINFSWCKISHMFGVSRWTVMRRVQGYGLPRNTALRWGALVLRRKYYVPWPNSLWHIDGHRYHSLIKWRFVVHGCCDGKSRKIMFLQCSTNNLAKTALELFKDDIKNNRGLWPSRIRVDRGVENVLICNEIVTHRGEGRHSFIAGSSTSNQRIERLWRDVFRCVPMNLLAVLKSCCRYVLLVCSHKESTLKTLQPEKKTMSNNHKNPLNKYMTVVAGRQCKHKGIPKQTLAFLVKKKYLNTRS